MKQFNPLVVIVLALVTACNAFSTPTPVPTVTPLPSPTTKPSPVPSPSPTLQPSPTASLAVNPTLVTQLAVPSIEAVATAWSFDGSLFALARLQRGLTIYQTQDFKPVQSITFDKPMVSFSDYTAGDPPNNRHGVLAFSPDGQWLATAHADNTVRLWNTTTANLQLKLSTEFQPGSIAFTPNTNFVAAGELNDKSTESGPGRPALTELWSVKTGKLVTKVVGRANSAPLVFFSDNKTLVIREQIADSDSRGHPGALRVMQLTDAGIALLWEKKNRLPISSVQISPDGSSITAVWVDDVMGAQHLSAWDAQTGNELFTWKPASTSGAIYLYPIPNRNIFAAWVTREKMVHLFETGTGREIKNWPLPTVEGDSDARFAYFSPSGRILAREVWTWPQRKGAQSAQAEFFTDETGGLMKTLGDAWLFPSLGNSPFNPKTGWLATRSNDGSIKIWSGIP
ncbi:MAG: WD40 repeat domain-containing protein [Chloroflexi bacterium]|nr:WD40 repeat domain-containing protein [Chloroflexota bacterium]